MRNTLLALAAILALAFASGCASAINNKSSARHTILPAGSHGVETSWTPAEDEITRLEKKLGRLFDAVDSRVTGLPAGGPPYSLSEYNIRYTGTGPEGGRYILGEAVHKSLPDAEAVLSGAPFAFPDRGGPRYFSVMYKIAGERVVAVRFNGN